MYVCLLVRSRPPLAQDERPGCVCECTPRRQRASREIEKWKREARVGKESAHVVPFTRRFHTRKRLRADVLACLLVLVYFIPTDRPGSFACNMSVHRSFAVLTVGGGRPTTFADSCTRRRGQLQPRTGTVIAPDETDGTKTNSADGVIFHSPFIQSSPRFLQRFICARESSCVGSVLSCSQPPNKRCFALRPLVVVQTQREHPHVGRQSDR